MYAWTILIGCFLGAHPLFGGQIVADLTGLASPALTINFTELGIPQNSALTDQYASLGVTFSAGMYQGDSDAQNFPAGPNPVITAPFAIYFTSVQSSAALRFVSNPGTSTFAALLDAAPVDSFATSTGAPAYYGFTGESFDEIQITPGGVGSAAFVIDIQLGSSPVPEPSACALLGGGLLGLLAWRRKRTA
ncbi:MAG: PEP-CTERM sorting domain-containing protein [Bryobacteraceae bacterium]